MRYTRYDWRDFVAIRDKKTTIDNVAKKYGVSRRAIVCAMSQAKIRARKTAVVMITPYQTKTFSSTNECAKAIGVSQPTVMKAVRGKRVPLLEQLEITIEEAKFDYGEEEYDD